MLPRCEAPCPRCQTLRRHGLLQIGAPPKVSPPSSPAPKAAWRGRHL